MMNDLQENYLSMYLAVHEVLTKFATVWQSNQGVSGCFNSLETYIDDIQKGSQAQLKKNKGIYKKQQKLRDWLTAEGFVIKDALKLHFTITGVDEQRRIFTYSKSHLVNLRKNDFYIALLQVAEKAANYVTPLVAMGITPQQISKLTQRVNELYAVILLIEEEEETKEEATADIAANIENCRLMLNDTLDLYMNLYSSAQPEMVTTYHNARRIVHSGGKRNYTSVVISGTVKDSATKKPLAGVEIIPETKGKSTVADSKGKFIVKMYKKDAKALLLILGGYESLHYLLPAKINEHKMAVEILMKKLTANEATVSYTFKV